MLIDTVLKHGNKIQILMLDDEIRKAEKDIHDNLQSYEISENNFPVNVSSDAEQSVLLELKHLVEKRVGNYCRPLTRVLDNIESKKEPERETVSEEVAVQSELQAQIYSSEKGARAKSSFKNPALAVANALAAYTAEKGGNDNISSDSVDTHNKQESSLLGKTLLKVSEHNLNAYD